MVGASEAGQTRLDRLQALKASYERTGIRVRHDVVPGVGHNGYAMLDAVQAFFAETLAMRGPQVALAGQMEE